MSLNTESKSKSKYQRLSVWLTTAEISLYTSNQKILLLLIPYERKKSKSNLNLNSLQTTQLICKLVWFTKSVVLMG